MESGQLTTVQISVADPDPDPHGASWIRIHQSEVWIRIRIWILLSPTIKVRETLIPSALWLLFDFLSLKIMYMYLQKDKQKNFIKNLFFVGILGRSMTNITGSGSTPKCHGSATLVQIVLRKTRVQNVFKQIHFYSWHANRKIPASCKSQLWLPHH